jgi:hypothetical protein
MKLLFLRQMQFIFSVAVLFRNMSGFNVRWSFDDYV